MRKSAITFEYNESHSGIDAIYTLFSADPMLIDKKWVQQELNSLNLGSCLLLGDKVGELLDIVSRRPTSSGRLHIADVKDADIIINTVNDQAALLTIIPPHGGSPATLEMVKKALAEKGVRYGFLLDALRMAIISGEAKDLLIAKSDPPSDGEDTQFVCILPEIKIRTPRISTKGNANYRDLKDVTLVEPGQELMRRVPATQGTSARNIFGEKIPPKPGKDSQYAANLVGVKPSDTDPDILIATTRGQPIIVDKGVNVESTMSVKQVDLSTGNVKFEGSVIVSGDVATGAQVIASGDITVRGTVESAFLYSGGDIIIRGVIVGAEAKHIRDFKNSNIKAQGSISAKSVEYANLDAGNNIYIEDWVVNSSVLATNEVIVGNVSANKGQIIGGRIVSGILVKAIRIGSNTGVETRIEVGDTSQVQQQLESVNLELRKQMALQQEVHKKINFMKKNPTNHAKELLKEAASSYVFLQESISELTKQRNHLKLERSRWKNAQVISEKTIYAGTTISIAGKEKHFQDDVGRRTMFLKDGKLSASFN